VLSFVWIGQKRLVVSDFLQGKIKVEAALTIQKLGPLLTVPHVINFMAVSLISHPSFLSSFGGDGERRWIIKTFHSLFKDFLNPSSEDFFVLFLAILIHHALSMNKILERKKNRCEESETFFLEQRQYLPLCICVWYAMWLYQ
jgi:hypothetical protein